MFDVKPPSLKSHFLLLPFLSLVFLLIARPGDAADKDWLLKMSHPDFLKPPLDQVARRLVEQLPEFFRHSYFHALDLNGDGVEEMIAETHQANMPGMVRPESVYIAYVIFSVNHKALNEGKDNALLWLGTIPVPSHVRWFPYGENPELWASTIKSGDWLSLTNGPMQNTSPWGSEFQALVGGHRFCWNESPLPIDWHQFGWTPTEGQIGFGLPYREGDPGYFKVVPESGDCSVLDKAPKSIYVK